MKTAKKNNEFVISLSIGSDTFKGKGDTALDALRDLQQPPKLMSKGVLTVAEGKLKKVVPMTPVQIKRLFHTSASTQVVRAKWLSMGLK